MIYDELPNDIEGVHYRETINNALANLRALFQRVAALESGGTGPVEPSILKPVNLLAPKVIGIARVGQILTGVSGTWANLPVEFKSQWLINDIAIAGATGLILTVTADMAGKRIKYREEALNSVGNGFATSLQTAIVETSIGVPTPNAPVNTAPPSISGTPQVGQTLIASGGSWSNNPTSFSWQWFANDVAINGATNSSLVLITSYLNQNIKVRQTASNTTGATSANSTQTAAVQPAQTENPAPVFTSQPTVTPSSGIAGTTTFNGTNGTASNTTSYSARWLLNGTEVATGQSFTPNTGQTGSLIFSVTATGPGGSTVQNTASVQIAASSGGGTTPVPVNTVAPTISGTTEPFKILTTTTGTWSGQGPLTYKYQWKANGVDIAGATANTYNVQPFYVGQNISASVIATNSGGDSIAAISAPVGPITKPADIVVSEGDSISSLIPDGYNAIWHNSHPTIEYYQMAVGGSTLTEQFNGGSGLSMLARRSTALGHNPTVLTIGIGANDLNNYTPQGYIDAIEAYVAPFRPRAKILVNTILPRTGRTGWNTLRHQYNQLLRDRVAAGQFDAIADFDNLPVGTDGAENTAIYPDGLHPTSEGHQQMNTVWGPAVNYLCSIPNEPQNMSFPPEAAATGGVEYISALYTVQGLYLAETRPYSVSAGGYVSKNGGTFVQNGSGTVKVGDTLRIKSVASTTAAQAVDTILTVGTTSATYSVTTSGAGGRDWVPTDLGSKLKLWLKNESLPAAGNNVDTWPDSSGNNVTVTGLGSSGKPRVETAAAGPNGTKAAYFEGNFQTYFSLPNGHASTRNEIEGSSTFFVGKNVSDPNTSLFGGPVVGWGTDNSGDFYPYVNGDVYSTYGSNTRYRVPDFVPSLTEWRMTSFHSARNDWRYYLDGVAINTLTSNVFAMPTVLRLGGDTVNNFFNGRVSEYVDCAHSLSTLERQKVEGYLAHKFGLQANLPSNHPYKTNKPTI